MAAVTAIANKATGGYVAPLVSVICVTRNAVSTLPALIESVHRFKTPQVEFVVIDGQSTDGTVELIKQHQNTVDFWLSEPDKGIYDAMNKAVKYAKGKWFIFFGADDCLLEGFEKMLPFLTDANTIYYGGVIYQEKPLCKKYHAYSLAKMNICHQGIFYPRGVFDKYEYDTQYVIWADYNLNLKCWRDRQFKFKHYSYIIAYYSNGGYSVTATDEAYERDKLTMFRRYLGLYTYLRYLNRNFGFWGMLKGLSKVYA